MSTLGTISAGSEAEMSAESEGVSEPILPPDIAACFPGSAYLWGSLDGLTMSDKVLAGYNEGSSTGREIFRIPLGRLGRPLFTSWPSSFKLLLKRQELSLLCSLLLQSCHTLCSRNHIRVQRRKTVSTAWTEDGGLMEMWRACW